MRHCRSSGRACFVNTHVEAALEVGAQGAHLTSIQSLSEALELRRRWNRPEFVLGKSVHSASEAIRAEEEGADYVILGPVFDPLSKPAYREPLGLSTLREVAQMLYIPVLGLGGMGPSRIPEIGQTNAVGFAGIGWIAREIADQLHAPG